MSRAWDMNSVIRSIEKTLVVLMLIVALGQGVHVMSYGDLLKICQTQKTGLKHFASRTCDTYFLCFAGSPLLRNCPPGTGFNAKTLRCDMVGKSCRNYHSVEVHLDKNPSNRKQNAETVAMQGKEDIVKGAMHKVKESIKTESRMAQKYQRVTDSGPFRYVSAFLYAKPLAKYMSYPAQVLLECHKLMKKSFHSKTPMEFLKISEKPGEPDTEMTVTKEMDVCPFPKTYRCDHSKRYRTADGSCNNLRHPLWGRSNVPHRRLLNANYGNGIDSMRTAVLGDLLPSARHVSRHLFRDMNRPSRDHSLFLMTWGQFLDHDLTRTAITRCPKHNQEFGETTEVKCGFDGCGDEDPGLESCWPIPVSLSDPDFGHTNRCLKFVRSEPTPPLDCTSGQREQLNQVTPWIDGSNIYGSTIDETRAVREIDAGRGRMKTTTHPKAPHLKNMLPYFNEELCRDTTKKIKCFLAGDERVNENPALTTLHIVWVREHNRIEEELHRINPHWSGEQLFQETRRIIIAMMQHIVMNEQLPLVLGDKLSRSYQLKPVDYGYYYGHNPRRDPRMSQAFATAAYRFGHTLIQDHFRRIYGKGKGRADDLILSETFFRPIHVHDLKQGGIDSILRGLGSLEAQTFDRFFTKQVSKSLFTERPPHGPGMDLLSLNIQRARDHGLPGYNDYRELCGLERASSFDDLWQEIPENHTRSILKMLYRHVDDIDLFPGGISERSLPGGVVGPTFGCIIGDQIKNLRSGDRFWYERRHKAGFTPDQLNEIRKMRLSRVVCANSDGIETIQPWVMLQPGDGPGSGRQHSDLSSSNYRRFYGTNGNQPMACSSLPDLDLQLWREASPLKTL